jgi:vacuolar-type H+-ATPase catalytic subunit A/Vma1
MTGYDALQRPLPNIHELPELPAMLAGGFNAQAFTQSRSAHFVQEAGWQTLCPFNLEDAGAAGRGVVSAG